MSNSPMRLEAVLQGKAVLTSFPSWQGCRLNSEAVQGHCSGSLVVQESESESQKHTVVSDSL